MGQSGRRCSSRNSDAIQIGLTATPREYEYTGDTPDIRQDQQITADNIAYFGDPVYDYPIGQGIEDGYLAAMEIHKRDIFLNRHREDERVTGVSQEDLEGKELQDALTGEAVSATEARERYEASSFEGALMLPDRIESMCADLFHQLLETGGPKQKTIIFCTRDTHADNVAAEMNNLYARWCHERGTSPIQDYAFKCTAEHGKDYLADLRGSAAHHFIATTVDLLTTGVDVPRVSNIVFFKYVRSPIAFYQMVGRGTRLHPPSAKLMFRVYDYTNATRLFGQDFKAKLAPTRPDPPANGGHDGDRESSISVQGFDVRISDAGTYILTTNAAGRTVPVTLEEYKQQLAARLVAEVPQLNDFRDSWIDPHLRRKMLRQLPDDGRSALVVQDLTEMGSYDLYDVLADLGYGQAPKTRVERARAFEYKQRPWLNQLPNPAAEAIRAIATQFAKGGTDNLENPRIFDTPEVAQAGGLAALRTYGSPATALSRTKQRMFAA